MQDHILPGHQTLVYRSYTIVPITHYHNMWNCSHSGIANSQVESQNNVSNVRALSSHSLSHYRQ
jgi:hypothetical protein